MRVMGGVRYITIFRTLFLRRFVVIALLAVSGGCNSLSADQSEYPPSPSFGGQPIDSGAQAELSRAADRYLGSSTPGATGYKVGPQDVLEISVFEAPELSKIVQVSDEGGTINVPLVGRMSAVGRSASAIERDLEARLDARYMKNPQVTVFVKEFNSQRMTVDGAVKKPGVFPVRGHLTLTQAIGYAGGADREIASSDVIVFRPTGGVRTVVRYDADAIVNGQLEDPQILAGDVIVVQQSQAKTYFQYAVRLLPLAVSLALVPTRF